MWSLHACEMIGDADRHWVAAVPVLSSFYSVVPLYPSIRMVCRAHKKHGSREIIGLLTDFFMGWFDSLQRDWVNLSRMACYTG